jgi:hypothetical protein
MNRHLEQWRGYRDLLPHHRDTVKTFLEGLHFNHLSQTAQAIRRLPDCKVLTDHFTAGRERIVFEVEFSDGTYWIARISLPPLPEEDHGAFLPCPGREVNFSEIVTMRYVATRTSIPIPRVHYYDLDPSNELGAPYMFMDKVFGKFIRPLPSTPIDDVPQVYSQFADIVLSLSRLTFPEIGMLSSDDTDGPSSMSHCLFYDLTLRKPFKTASEYFTSRFQDFFDQKKTQVPSDENWIVMAWLCIQSIPHFLLPEMNNGPFPMHHPDLNNGNILYDDSNNMVGVLDWTASGSFPWESAMAPPEALSVPYFPERRKMYIDIFEKREIEFTGGNKFSEFMRSPKGEIVNLVNDNFYGYGDRFPYQRAGRLTTLVYGSETSWEDVKMKYREWELLNGVVS